MYCISSASEKKHEIARTSWSSCLWKLCELVSIVEEQLCVVFMYTGTPISSPMVQKCVHLKWFCFVYDVWTTDLGKNIEISSDPHSPFHCHAYIIFFSFTIFFHDLWLGYLVYSRVTLDLWLILIHRDLWNSQKWQVLISVNRDLDFFLKTEICDQKPLHNRGCLTKISAWIIKD
jgi:hypothetical protein